jgi:hypothetical protein
VTKAPAAERGKRSSSSNQPSATRSTNAVAGAARCSALFWSQAAASQWADSAAGRTPPVTKPKYRPPAVACVAGDANASSSSSTRVASTPRSGSGVSSEARAASASAEGETLRSSSASR